jgi:uncharacterized protein YabN with tetrapyrrole methylase and pyrophosphatase domain
MKESQQRVKEFNEARDWSDERFIKDLLLNMSEEIGEMWNLIKWLDTEDQTRVIRKHKEEVENFIGDMLYLVFKVSYICRVDPQKALDDVLEEYEKRFPVEQTKGKHGNPRAGGIDLKTK